MRPYPAFVPVMENKIIRNTIILLSVLFAASCGRREGDLSAMYGEIASRDIGRAVMMTDSAVNAFLGPEMRMYRTYDPFKDSLCDSRVENVWEYSSAFEAAANILSALKMQKEKGDGSLHALYFSRFKTLADSLYSGMQYYRGSYELTSYTKIRHPWTVYGVPRAEEPGSNDVSGILNVYDDQMWLMRDFIEIYRATGDRTYLEEAEYLAEYVIDGYDCHIDENGKEYGGITWGPGYVSKHSCSNGPAVSPLVWLSEIFKGSGERSVRHFISPDDRKTPVTEEMDRSEYYLYYAEKVYDYQKEHLLRADGVYDDMMGGAEPSAVYYEPETGGYRGHNDLTSRIGPAYTYNSGTMLSAAADLYRNTGKKEYLDDLKSLTDAAFGFFAVPDPDTGLYVYDFSGNGSWFNSVLLRGFADASALYDGAVLPAESFQKIYDHAFSSFIQGGMFPPDLYKGWSDDPDRRAVRGRDQFAYAAQYALLAEYFMARQ